MREHKQKLYIAYLTSWHNSIFGYKLRTNLACLHNQNKSDFFGGLDFFQPIRAFGNFSDCSD